MWWGWRRQQEQGDGAGGTGNTPGCQCGWLSLVTLPTVQGAGLEHSLGARFLVPTGQQTVQEVRSERRQELGALHTKKMTSRAPESLSRSGQSHLISRAATIKVRDARRIGTQTDPVLQETQCVHPWLLP